MVPSGFWVTVFSLVVTAPVGLTRVSSVLEIVRAHPLVSKETAKTDIVANANSLPVLMCFIDQFTMGSHQGHWGETLAAQEPTSGNKENQ